MKRIGLLGGLTWHSTARYYERINLGIAAELGPFRSASIVMHSIDYGQIRQAREDGNWRRLGRHLVAACRGLKRSGAEGLFLCSNTIHRFAPQIESETGLEVVHIVDAVIAKAEEQGVQTLGLFGTQYTVTQSFYVERLEAAGLRVLISDPPAVAELDRILLEEVAAGVLRDPSRDRFVREMVVLRDQGAEAMVLGCTEIGLLVKPSDLDVPMLETAEIHADFAVKWALR